MSVGRSDSFRHRGVDECDGRTDGQTDRIIHGGSGRYTALACIMRLSRAIKMCQAAVEFSVDLSLVQRLRAENSLLLQRIEQLEKVSRCAVSGFTEWIFGFTQSLYRPNFITSIVCGFVVQLVIQQIHNKSERSPQQVRNKSNACSKSATSSLQIHNSSTNPQRVYNMSTTNPQQIEVVEFGPFEVSTVADKTAYRAARLVCCTQRWTLDVIN